MINWKVLAIFGVVGFLLSLFIGIVSSVSAGVVLLRALLFGIVFAGIGFGITFLINQFLPELLQNAPLDVGSDHPSEGNTVSGSRIDMTAEGGDINTSELYGHGGDSDIADDVEDIPLAESVDDGGGLESPAAAESVGYSSPAPEAAASVSSTEAASAKSLSVDELPDLEEFSDSFQTVVASTDGVSMSGGSVNSGPGVDVMGDEHSPATVAKAVQSVMKKDQEG